MRTIAEELAREIESQQSEVDRLKRVVDMDYPEALARLNEMKAVALDVQPDLERLAAKLAAVRLKRLVDVRTVLNEPAKEPNP